MPIDNVEFLLKYKKDHRYFCETGTFVGRTVQYALDAEFEFIRSVELNLFNFEICRNLFRDYSNIKLYCGESENLFWSMIKDINEPVLFFLDSHYSGVSDYYQTSKGRTYSSLVSELLTIAKHPIKNHTIFIDDIRDFKTINMDYVTKEKIFELIININPDYEILFDTGDSSQEIFIDDILIARV